MNQQNNMKKLLWKGSPRVLAFDESSMQEKLANTDQPCYVVKDFRGRIGITNEGEIGSEGQGLELLALAPAAGPADLGDRYFSGRLQHKVLL